jgi:hypothetical protein
MRIPNIREIKTVPYVPRSNPLAERLIGIVRRECLDRMRAAAKVSPSMGGPPDANEPFLRRCAKARRLLCEA